MFGQVVIGPPGSGKSTYCYGMYQFLCAIGRKLCIVNLDPANDRLPYPVCELDIRDYITLEDVMDQLGLGPNGGLMYALDSFREVGMESFLKKVESLTKHNYIIFDCPGQVELFTHNNILQNLFKRLTKLKCMRLCVISLIDSIHLTSPSQYVSMVLLSLTSMLQLDLPHVNVISKIDMLKSYGSLPLRLDFYTDAQDLKSLKPYLEKESNSFLGKNFVRLTELIADVVEDFGLVSFEVLAIENKQAMINLLCVIDKANGYTIGSNEIGGDTIWRTLVGINTLPDFRDVDLHERWIDNKEEYDEYEKNEQIRALNENEGLIAGDNE